MYLQVGDSGPRVICSGRLALLQLFKHQFAPLGLKQRSTFIKLQGSAGVQSQPPIPLNLSGIKVLEVLCVSSDRPRLCMLGDHRWSMPLFFPASSVAHSGICHGHTTAYNAIFSLTEASHRFRIGNLGPCLGPLVRQEHYNDPVPAKDKKLITTFSEKFVDTTCHGCVWYHDADPNQYL